MACMKFCDNVDNSSSISQYHQMQQNTSEYSRSNTNTLDKRTTLKDLVSNNANSSNMDNLSRKFKSFSLGKSESNLSSNLKMYIESQRKLRFIIPIVTHPEIANVKMRELVQRFRNELLVYDMEKYNGILLNLPDIIQCGMFGICGISKNREELIKFLEKSINLIKEIVTNKKEEKSISFSYEKRTDLISVFDIIGRIKYYVKNDK